jgi:hypothetical protein
MSLLFVLTQEDKTRKNKRGKEKYYTIFNLYLYVEFYRRKIKQKKKENKA